MSIKRLIGKLTFATLCLSANLSGIYHNHFVDTFDPSWNLQHSPFFIHAIPKCGTHYIQRIIHLMTPHDIYVGNLTQKHFLEASRNRGVVRTFEPFNKQAEQFARRCYLKMIAMVRDPRDALISHLFYMDALKDRGKNRDFFVIGNGFDDLSLDERITALILGDGETMSYIDFYLARIGWATKTNSLTVRYEDLVGDEEGANQKKIRTIKGIAKHINLDLSEDHLVFIINNMYSRGKKDPEAEGKIYERASSGNWRTFLNETHKALLKAKLGDVLIDLGYENGYDW